MAWSSQTIPSSSSYPCARILSRASARLAAWAASADGYAVAKHEGALLCAKIDDTGVNSPSVVPRVGRLMDGGGDLDHEEATYHGC